MQKGIFSHACCCASRLYNKHIVTLDAHNRLLSISPFTQEMPHTLFIDGLVIVTDTTFDNDESNFMEELQHDLLRHPHKTLIQAIQENSIYRQHTACIDSPCAVYTLQPIDWHTMLPASAQSMYIKKVV